MKRIKSLPKISEEMKIVGEIVATIRDAKTNRIKRIYKHKNIIVTEGREVIARRLSNETTYTGVINYGALGTSVVAPANGDTQLGAEVFRKATSSATYSANVAYLSFFYSASDCDGTYREFGNFIDGGVGINTGQLFTHVSVNWVKSNTETLPCDCQYSVN